MGMKLIIQGTKLTDLTAPKLPVVDIMEAAGSLALFEPRHPQSKWAAGIPANDAAIPNVLAEKAMALLGASSSAAVAGKAFLGSGWPSGPGRLERTPKGGIHGIPSLTAATANERFSVFYPDSIEQWIIDNPTHLYYISHWVRPTRIQAQTTSFAEINNIVSGANNHLALPRMGNNVPTSAGGRVVSGLGAQLQNQANSYQGAIPEGVGYQSAATMMLGSGGLFGSTDTQRRGKGAMVHYRSYLEDLTVSGRTYAAADALDFAEFTKQVLTAGGRYFGDTFTDPATIA